MLIFGSLQARYAYNSKEEVITYNFNTMYENCEQIIYLNPYRCNRWEYSTLCNDFDIWYGQYLQQSPDSFREFINFMRNVYNGKDVWVLVDFSVETAVSVVEYLIKYIYEMYGYVSNIVKEPEDLENLKEGDFSARGIQTFDQHLIYYLITHGSKGLEEDNDD